MKEEPYGKSIVLTIKDIEQAIEELKKPIKGTATFKYPLYKQVYDIGVKELGKEYMETWYFTTDNI